MTGAVRKSPAAFADLDDIAAFIGSDNPSAAIRFLGLLEEKFAILAASPSIGTLRPELADGLRAFPVSDYCIFYRPAGDAVEIIRVLHGARDINALFQPSDYQPRP